MDPTRDEVVRVSWVRREDAVREEKRKGEIAVMVEAHMLEAGMTPFGIMVETVMVEGTVSVPRTSCPVKFTRLSTYKTFEETVETVAVPDVQRLDATREEPAAATNPRAFAVIVEG